MGFWSKRVTHKMKKLFLFFFNVMFIRLLAFASDGKIKDMKKSLKILFSLMEYELYSQVNRL